MTHSRFDHIEATRKATLLYGVRVRHMSTRIVVSVSTIVID